MNSRRTFLQQTGTVAAAALLSQSALANVLTGASHTAAARQVGIQLFTLRELLAKNPESVESVESVERVIANLAKIGYKQVETFYGYPGAYATRGFWGLDATAFRSLLAKYHLSSPSGHYNVTDYLVAGGTDDILKSHIETAAAVGQQYFVIPGLPANIRQAGTIDDYKQMAAKFNKAAELCKASKLKMAYHNHAFEFKDLGGTTGYEILLKETDPALVHFELDLFWVINGGIDPLTLFKQHPKRFKMWHVKDMDKADQNVYTEVGTGRIDFKSIFKNAKEAGMEYLFIEQDVIKIDPYQSITQSIDYLKKELI